MSATYNQIIQQGIQARQANNRQAALALFKEAIALDPAQFTAYREAGTECRDLSLFGEAENFYRQAQELAPKDLVTAVQWALCHRRQGKHKLCLQQLRAIADSNRENGWVCNELAITLKQMGRLGMAERWFRQALAVIPTNVHVLLEFGLLARMLGKRELALAQFEAVSQYHPSHVGAYIEAATELQALGRQNEAIQKLRFAFVHSQNQALLEKYLVILFEQNALAAIHELLLHAAYYPVSTALVQHFFSYILAGPQDAIDLNTFPKKLAVALLSQASFSSHLMLIKVNHFDTFISLLSYLEPVLISLTEDAHQPLMDHNLFLLLIVFSWYKKNSLTTAYVTAHTEKHIAKFEFNDLCKITTSLVGLTNAHEVLSLFAKAAIEQKSVDCLLVCLIMRGYYPEEPCLVVFDDKETLKKQLPSFFVPKNEAVLKNIFTHLLQTEKLTLAEVEELHPSPAILKSIKAIDDALKPMFQANRSSFSKPEKLKVALCISGQLRGYKEAFVSVKKSIVEPLQPDIFVHTWQDVGFREPASAMIAHRVFQGKFLQAYLNLLLVKNYSYQDIKKMLPTVFSLLNNNTSVSQQQLKDFYQTDYVVVEDDQAPPYVTLDKQQKMLYKIDACNQLVQATGKPYDLVIRLRPDMELSSAEEIDWPKIAEICNRDKVLFVEWCTSPRSGLGNLFEGGLYVTGDKFAIGSQSKMSFYAGVLKLQEVFIKHGITYVSSIVGHSLLAHGLWLGGYSTKEPPSLALGKLLNTSLKAEEILQAIKNDLPNLDKDVADELVGALEQDIVKQG